ncbi:MAG: (E)-4-hydroxy-3-methylbut-2-enyl-diphosphate synthase [Taibaiella sp.]|nr:(E)-4-hydroxy-3-methylbut-2-enyl-diphosphate synthase [Taibaiella sp.]
MLQYYCPSLTQYTRLRTKEVNIGGLMLGGTNPIRIQTMTTTDTMDTAATVAQSIRCIEAGAELVRITAPSKREAENLLNIKNAIRAAGYTTPLVADIHFTPNAAEIAARIVEKVRVNPGNYVDKKKFDIIEYTDAEYEDEVARIRDRFTPLVRICKEYGTAMRIGTNHGSLSDRIMSRYGDSAIGMVESAMEFLRIARYEYYHQVVLSMKSSNPLVMVQAYRLLIQKMDEEFGECYPLHLGVTEAGDGEDGRIKSAIGIGTLLEDGIGDTIRVSLTEDPELEIPVCRDIVARYQAKKSTPKSENPKENGDNEAGITLTPDGYEDQKSKEESATVAALPYDPLNYKRRESIVLDNMGGHHVPVVIADYSTSDNIQPEDLTAVGYKYDAITDKWHIGDGATDYIYTSSKTINFPLPGTLKVICDHTAWQEVADKEKYYPLLNVAEYLAGEILAKPHFVLVNADANNDIVLNKLKIDLQAIVCAYCDGEHAMQKVRCLLTEMQRRQLPNIVILKKDSVKKTVDEQLIDLATETGGLLLDGFGDGIWLSNSIQQTENIKTSGRTYLEVKNNHQFLNNTAFSILQATRTRISKTEYISCPSCGRTLFDLQETTALIRAATNHLKGVKIAIMGCIVNGPGEMADADFGYVGSGPGKITLYRGKDVMKRNVPSEIAVDELIQLLKDNDAWVETPIM